LNKEAVYELCNVSYNYPTGETGLVDINFKIYKGEKIVLLGANGSGKSTLLMLMNGLVFPNKGEIKALGVPLTEENLSRENYSFNFRRRCGFVFQNPDVQLFNPSVWEEIAFGPLHAGFDLEEIHRRVNDVIAILNLDHLKNRPPFKLSGGEKKKVALASVLSLNPEILLLDEPTENLDARSQGWLVETLLKLHESGKTIIATMHDLNILPVIADRVIVLGENHDIIADGACSEIINNYEILIKANLYDERFHKHQHNNYIHLHTH